MSGETQEDILDSLFGEGTSEEIKAPPQDGCLLDFVGRVTQYGIEKDRAVLALDYVDSQIENPVPVVTDLARDTLETALTRLTVGIVVIIAGVVLMLAWLLVYNKTLKWQLALIFTVFVFGFALIVGLIVKSSIKSYVNARSDETDQYINTWVETELVKLPAAISQALCIYTYPPDGIPPTSSTGEPIKSRCAGVCK